MLSFELNQGQADPEVRALARTSGYGLLLTAREAVLTLRAGDAEQPTVLRVRLLGSNAAPAVSGVDRLPGTVSYYVGSDPARWHAGLPTYAAIRYASVYPGVDLMYHGTKGELEYDFVVAPGASPDVIRFEVSGADTVTLDADGALALATARGTVLHRRPVLYQDIDGTRRMVDGRFRLHDGNQVSFEVGDYDRRHTLVIDPTLATYTYFGGTGTDQIKTLAVSSPFGLTFFGGATSSTSLPSAANTYSGGSTDSFISATGSNATDVLMTLFLGGSGTDAVNSLALDPAAIPTFLVVTGLTNSPDFPTLAAAQATPGGNFDAFVARYNIAMSGGVPEATLAFSTYLGGSHIELGAAVATSNSATGHAIFVAGSTWSDNFPALNAAQGTKGGSSDAFLARYTAAGVKEFATYFGGPGGEQGLGLAVFNQASPAEAIPFVSGTVNMSSTAARGLVFSMSGNGSSLRYSRVFGGATATTLATGIAVDNDANAYLTGVTNDPAFPVVNAVQPTHGGNDDAFVMHLNPAGSPVFSTYYGGTGADKAFGITVDTFSGGNNNIIIAGQTSGGFPATAVDTTFGGVLDGFVLMLNGGITHTVNYATYVGGTGADIIYAVCVGSAHNVRVAGITNSAGLATPGVAQPTIAGGLDGFVARIDTN